MNCFNEKNELSNECFETVLQSIAEGLFIIDPSGTIRFCNKGLEQMSGYAADQIVGKRCRDIMVCACDTMEACGLFSQGSLNNLECQLKRSDGKRVPVLKNGQVLRDKNGTIAAGIETLTDISALKNAERLTEVLREQAGLKSGSLDLLIGKSQAMQNVFELINLAAASQATVLITGETGTGKELAARSIHGRSPRQSGPLITVNCSSLPESLLESELFGHAKGSFTGAIKDKIGRFEMAEGGTLFLDEIGDISPFIQVKLLRFLQERQFERVGEGTTRKADVRIIAATHRDLRALVSEGRFREDLYYRLKVFPIELPPLRLRKEDIGPLINHFTAKFNAQTGKSIKGLTAEAAVTIMDYCWPGNIRELENAIEHAFVTCHEIEIGLFDLPLEIRHVELRQSLCLPKSTSKNVVTDARDQVQTITPELLRITLEQNLGNRMKTAQALMMDRTTLWRYMKKWGIEK